MVSWLFPPNSCLFVSELLMKQNQKLNVWSRWWQGGCCTSPTGSSHNHVCGTAACCSGTRSGTKHRAHVLPENPHDLTKMYALKMRAMHKLGKRWERAQIIPHFHKFGNISIASFFYTNLVTSQSMLAWKSLYAMQDKTEGLLVCSPSSLTRKWLRGLLVRGPRALLLLIMASC
jgi:hypothetical protein